MLMNNYQHHQSNRKPAVLVVLLITGVLLSGPASRTVHAYWSDLEIVSIENFNSSGTIVFDVDVKRLTRTEFAIAGTVTVAADYQSTTTDIVIYFSAKANNQYVLLPLKFGAKPTCEQVNGLYVKYVMKDLADVSDLPQVDEPGQEVCDLMTDVRHIYMFNIYGGLI